MTPAARVLTSGEGHDRSGPLMGPEDIARQMVIIIDDSEPHPRLERVLQQLAPYSPKLVAGWELNPEEGEVLVRLYQFEVVPPQETIDKLNKLPGVELERNMTMSPAAVPNDPGYQDRWTFYKPQWALRRMCAEQAWDCATTIGAPSPVVVAVIDSGVAQAHPDLAGRVHSSSRCFIPGLPASAIEDEDGHGTLLAGTIAAVTGDAFGIASATWPVAVSLLVLKFYNPWNQLNAALAAQAIAFAADNGAKVINASWHVGMPSKVLRKHIKYAAKKDVLFVAAGGNEGTNNDLLPIWPASYSISNIVAVMASDRHDERPAFSNYGPSSIHLAAPGVRIMSTHYYLSQVSSQPPPRWREYSGTSASAAQVTAAAALVRAFRPNWDVAHVAARLLASVKHAPFLECISEGRLDLEKLVCGLPP
jgi:subtilisin family serine protease